MVDLSNTRLSIDSIIIAIQNIDSAKYMPNSSSFDKYKKIKDILNLRKPRINGMVSNLNASLKQYIQSGGITPRTDDTTDSNYSEMKRAFNTIFKYRNAYELLNRKLSALLRDTTNNSDANAKTSRIGELQNTIANLKKDIEQFQQDLDVAKSRQASLESPREKVSFYQGFASRLGFTNPLHKWSVPLLFGFGILSLILSAIMIREFFAPGALSTVLAESGQIISDTAGSIGYGNNYGYESASSFRPKLLAMGLGALLIFAGFIALAVYGFLGKQ